MKKILFIFSLVIFVIACKSTPESTTPEDVVIADEPVAQEETVQELYLPADCSIRETDRGRILETNPKIVFKFVETNMPATADMSFAQVIEFWIKILMQVLF